MRTRLFKFSLLILTLVLVGLPARAQIVHLNANQLIARVGVSLSPKSGTFVEQSTFDVPILLDTRKASVNGVEVRINFDHDKLEIIKPSSGLSIIGVWVEPPGYDNSKGTASYVGVIPNGITTASGLVGTITFKAKKIGKTSITFSTASKVLLNDGQGTEAQTEFGRADYVIMPKAPEGVEIYSETHPSQSEWYNNNSPVVSWIKEPGVSGFSFVLDDKPATVPENTITSSSTSKQFPNLSDGLWYFHIKSYKNGVWGSPGHFLIRIDTAPPADFKPEVNYLFASANLGERALVSFFTTDNLSGIDHYEIGVIDKDQPVTVSPAFVQAESPFQLPITGSKLSAIVRAVDGAGNVRDASISVGTPSLLSKFLMAHLVTILLIIILAGFVGLILHYLVGHHILRVWKKAVELMKKEEQTSVTLPAQEKIITLPTQEDTLLPPSHENSNSNPIIGPY